MQKVLLALRDSLKPCSPPWWARTGHAQTMLGHLLNSPPLKEKGETLNVTLEKENERIQTTYLKGETNVVVYLFHGLGGSSDAAYMQRTAKVARELGHHVFLNNHRGCGEGAGLATEPYHSGRAEDLSRVIAFGREMLPKHRHIAIGFSLSANALLLLAAGQRAEILPDAAIAVNGPIDLNQTSLNLIKGLNKIYDNRFLDELRRYVKLNNPNDFHLISKVKDLREFDEAYTAIKGGFKNHLDYYEKCSAKNHLEKIKIPTVLLTAKDDPFVHFENYLNVKLSSTTILHLEEYGGHMGYIGKKGLGFYRWMDYALKNYLDVLSVQEL